MTSYTNIFQTMPLPCQKLIRDPETLSKLIITNDDKTIPFKQYFAQQFKQGWDTTKNQDAPIHLIETGRNNVIAIDFDGPDGDHYFHKAIDLDPNCQYIAKGVGKGGGHLIYRTGNTSTLDKIIPAENGCKITGLDLQRGRKLILLATPANETKELLTEPLTSFDQLTEMPEVIQYLVGTMYLSSKQFDTNTKQGTDQSVHRDSKLYYIVKEAIDAPHEYHHSFFNIVTTQHYKAILDKNPKHPEYRYIPDNLPMSESANGYLVSIATILGRDPSIDKDTFEKALNYTNSLFSSPYPDKELDSIIKYITSGNSKIDGQPVWQYNQDWKSTGMIFTDHKGRSHEIFQYVDKGQVQYLDHNHISNEITPYRTAGGLMDAIKANSSISLNKEKLLKKVKQVTLLDDPQEPFGVNEHDQFNLYKRTPEQEIFMNPESYQPRYQYPETTMKALESTMGHDRLYNFFLPFWKRKLTTREFSPLIMVLYGPPHSGKSYIPNGVLAPLVKGRNQTLSPEILTEKYNDWKLNKDIVFVDEIHNMRSDIQTAVIGTMNTISGSHRFTDIRAMQQSVSATEYPNYITFIVACNDVVQLVSEVQDRRTVILRSRQKLSEALQLGDDKIHEAIQSETKDFAYYLATEVEQLSANNYLNNAWLKDEDYAEFHQEALSFDKALIQAVDRLNFKQLEELLADNNIDRVYLAGCCHWVKDEIQIRLFNSKEEDAHYPSVLRNVSIDVNKTMRLLKNIRDADKTKIKWKVYDTKDGDKRLNKKTCAVFPVSKVPEDFLAVLTASGSIPEINE